jgi:predicted secreted protein
MDKKTFIIIIVMIIAVIGIMSLKQGPKPSLKPQDDTKTTKQHLLELFSSEYSIKADETNVNLTQEKGDYARGDFKAGSEQGIFLANKRDGQWVIVFSGNTPLPCTGIEKYNFPEEMLPECVAQKETEQNAISMEATTNKTFNISLESNPSTGYSWQAIYDQDYFELVDQKFETSSDLIGAGGKEVFYFKALKTGEKFIDFEYLRTWEKDQVQKRISYKMLIK